MITVMAIIPSGKADPENVCLAEFKMIGTVAFAALLT